MADVKNLIQKVYGFLVPHLFACTVIAINKYTEIGQSSILIFSEFVVIPMLIGIISTWFWRKYELSSGKLTAYAFYNTVIALVLSFIFLGEGTICLFIVSPLIFGFISVGSYMGRGMFKKNDHTLNLSILGLLGLVFVVDSLSEHQYVNLVSDEMIINAPPRNVWKYVVAFDQIKKPKDSYWLFDIGLPSPVQSTVDGYRQGAGRKCIFSNGYVFDEKITVYQPSHNLTFDITRQPKDPEIMGHIDILRGQFILKDNGNGTTKLIGNSWYKLYIFPVWYYDIWAKSITRNVHSRVMEHIKELSEKDTGVHVRY